MGGRVGNYTTQGCHRAAGKVDVDHWNKCLADLRVPRHATNFADRLLANSSPEVQNYLTCKVPLFKLSLQSLDSAKKQKLAKEAYYKQVLTLLWPQQFERIRSFMEARGHKFPSLVELYASWLKLTLPSCDQLVADSADNSHTLPFRHYVKMKLLETYFKVSVGRDIADKDFCQDLSEQLDHTVPSTPHKMPVILKSHVLYMYNVNRVATGVEQLRSLGHPQDLRRDGISDRQLCLLAGNTRSVEFLCCEILLFLLNIDFTTTAWLANPLNDEVAISSPYVKFGAHPHTSYAYLTKTPH